MITAAHSIIYASDPPAARAFFRDVLEMPNIDINDGWLIFKLPPSELGVHPAGPELGASGRQEIYLMCDDVEKTVVELTAKGAEFSSPIAETRFGWMTTLVIPGAGELGLYQPKHATAHDLPG